MSESEFVQLVLSGAEAAALAALVAGPNLASARSDAGVSVICLAVYRGQLKLGAAMADRRRSLDVFEASCLGDVARVTALVGEQPDLLRAHSPDGFSALGYSAFFGYQELLEALIRSGAPVNEPSHNPMRVCPLHSAAAARDPLRAAALARKLLEAGADPNARQQGGYTALHEAALHDKRELLELLLQHGADLQLANEQSERPADLARQKGHTHLAERLEQHATRER